MSVSYDLELVKAIKALFVADNVDPDASNNELCIHSFVADRIVQGDVPLQDVDLPQISISVTVGPGVEEGLPAEHAMMDIKAWYPRTTAGASLSVSRCGARIRGLLDHKPQVVFQYNSALHCYLLDRIDGSKYLGEEEECYVYQNLFDVVMERSFS